MSYRNFVSEEMKENMDSNIVHASNNPKSIS